MAIRSFEQRFCPIVNHNVALEVQLNESAPPCSRCLCEYECIAQYGECRFPRIAQNLHNRMNLPLYNEK